MTIRDVLRWGFNKLQELRIDSYQLDTELLLAKALFHPEKPTEKEFLKYVKKMRRVRVTTLLRNQEIKETTKQEFEQLVRWRSKRIPVAYLTNIKEFYGLPFYVDERVLIPRPQTEFLIERVVKHLTMEQWNNGTIVDIGTGSGCIIVAIAKEALRLAQGDKLDFIATDTSPKALIIAKRNARIHQVSGKIRFYKIHSLPPIKTQRVTIVANLPYLDKHKKDYFYKTSPELKHEPSSALFAGHKGLEHYNELIRQIAKIKKKQISCFFEIDPHQQAELSHLVQSRLNIKKIEYEQGVFSFSIT